MMSASQYEQLKKAMMSKPGVASFAEARKPKPVPAKKRPAPTVPDVDLSADSDNDSISGSDDGHDYDVDPISDSDSESDIEEVVPAPKPKAKPGPKPKKPVHVQAPKAKPAPKPKAKPGPKPKKPVHDDQPKAAPKKRVKASHDDEEDPADPPAHLLADDSVGDDEHYRPTIRRMAAIKPDVDLCTRIAPAVCELTGQVIHNPYKNAKMVNLGGLTAEDRTAMATVHNVVAHLYKSKGKLEVGKPVRGLEKACAECSMCFNGLLHGGLPAIDYRSDLPDDAELAYLAALGYDLDMLEYKPRCSPDAHGGLTASGKKALKGCGYKIATAMGFTITADRKAFKDGGLTTWGVVSAFARLGAFAWRRDMLTKARDEEKIMVDSRNWTCFLRVLDIVKASLRVADKC